MKRIFAAALVAGAMAGGAAADAAAQQGPPAQNFLAVGTPAPDVSFTGATRYGLLAEPVRLSQFHGQTVVIAFFFRARTPG
jgi:cytochrome oxidase Cu insertion factor (SCO1/SenC/PrrC family)